MLLVQICAGRKPFDARPGCANRAMEETATVTEQSTLSISSASVQGLIRLAKAEEHMDARTYEVLAHHLALERELLIVLARLVADARPFAKDSFGFAAKVDALESLWTFGGAGPLATALRRFNDLRNSLAHGHSKEAIDKKEASLRFATIALVGEDHGLDWTIKGSAACIMGYMNSPADDHLTIN